MKKLSLILALILALSLAACGGAASSAPASQAADSTGDVQPAEATGSTSGVDIGYCVPDTTNPFVGWLTTEVQALADEDGLTVQIADAGNSVTTQLEQVENFIAMKVKALALMPVDPMSMPDVIEKAQAQGIKVLVAGTDTGVYDVMMNVDQYACGEEVAQMGIDWLLENFSTDGTPEGLAEKPKVVVIKYTATPDGNNRSNGIIDGITNWGHADVVIAQTEAITAAEATSVMENMWQQNSDAVLVMTYNADSAVGVNEYLMGLQGLDRDKIAVFSADTSDPVQEVINMSATNDSVFRGTMGIIGPVIDGEQVDLPLATYNALKGLTEGELVYGDMISDAVARVYPETEDPNAAEESEAEAE